MAILVDRNSRILIQGITGGTGRSYARRMIEHGTPLVGGVSPGKGGEVVEGVPVFNSMREAVLATGADSVLSALPRERALDGIYEAVEAGTLGDDPGDVAEHVRRGHRHAQQLSGGGSDQNVGRSQPLALKARSIVGICL